MNEQLKIIITAQTAQAQKNLKEVKAQVGDLADEGEAGGAKFGAAMGAMGKATTVALAATATAIVAVGTAIVGLTTAAIKNYAEYEQLVGGVDTLFGTAAEKVEGYADEAYKTAGMSANAYMETVTSFSASLLQSLKGDTAAAADAANQAVIDMADNANKMGTSMESIQNAYQGFAKQNFTMLDNLKLGYGGTKEEMQRLLEDAEKISGIKYDISNLNDVYGAIHVIQTELGITGTTAKEAGTTIQGSAAAMKGAWENLLTGMANEGADIDALLTNFINSIGAFAENLIPRIEIALGGLTEIIGKVAPQLAAAIPQIVSVVLPKLLEAVTSIIQSIAAALPNLIGAIVAVIPNLIQALVAALSAIVEALPQIVAAIVGALPTIVPALLNGVIGLVLAILNNVMAIIQPIIDALPLLIQGITEALIANLPLLIEGIITLVTSLVAALPDILMILIDSILILQAGIAEAVISSLPTLLVAIGKLILEIVKALPPLLLVIVRTVLMPFEQLWNGIKAIFSVVDGWFGGIFSKALNKIKEVFKPLGNFFKDIWEGIKKVFSTVGSFYLDAFKKAVDNIKNVFSGIKSFFSGVWNSIKDIFSKVGSTIASAITNTVKTAINGVLSTAVKIINGFIKSINFAIDIINAIPSVNISKLSQLSVPQLAKGGVIDSATLAIVGERGKEAVVPLENNLGWLDKLATMLNDRIDSNGKQPIVLMVDKKVLAQATTEGINEHTRQTGYFPLVLA